MPWDSNIFKKLSAVFIPSILVYYNYINAFSLCFILTMYVFVNLRSVLSFFLFALVSIWLELLYFGFGLFSLWLLWFGFFWLWLFFLGLLGFRLFFFRLFWFGLFLLGLFFLWGLWLRLDFFRLGFLWGLFNFRRYCNCLWSWSKCYWLFLLYFGLFNWHNIGLAIFVIIFIAF